MKFFYQIAALFGTYLLAVTQIFANGAGSHVPGEEHNDVAAVDPMVIVIVPVALVVGGFILWKFVLNNHKSSSPTASVPEKTPPAQEKTVSQNNQIESSQKNG